MQPIPSTAEILLFRMLGRDINKKWIDWAYNMLVAGFETECLVMLAGETEPYNQFELKRLTDKVFQELNLTWDDRGRIYRNYIFYLSTKALNGEMSAFDLLSVIKDVCIELEYESFLMDFYLLYFAYDELEYSEYQSYWDGATRENIDEITKEYFKEWMEKCNDGE